MTFPTLPKLDRLSALLEGLAPVVRLEHSSQSRIQGPQPEGRAAIQLHFLVQGAAELQAGGAVQRIEAPALVAIDAHQPYVLDRFSSKDARRLITALVDLTGPVAALFLEEFACARTVALKDDEPALRLAIAMIESELDAPRCGQPALLDRAGDILFIGLLRYLVAHPGIHGQGLFSGLADPRIAKALVAMHQHPALAWDLELLAQEAGMSRTAFASKFHAVMRRPPGKYLSAIRLAIAQRAVDQGRGLKEAARMAGYQNSSALSRALSKARQHELQRESVVQA
jgi:AraC-like DNA-binding protein